MSEWGIRAVTQLEAVSLSKNKAALSKKLKNNSKSQHFSGIFSGLSRKKRLSSKRLVRCATLRTKAPALVYATVVLSR